MLFGGSVDVDADDVEAENFRARFVLFVGSWRCLCRAFVGSADVEAKNIRCSFAMFEKDLS